MTTRVMVIAVAGTLAFGATARAQTGLMSRTDDRASRYVDPVAGLDLERAIAIALEHEPDLRALRSEVDVARGMRLQAGLGPNPTVSFSEQAQPAGMGRQSRVEFVWPLDLFRKAGRVGVADREIAAARHTVSNRERLLAAEVRSKYGRVAAAARELAVLDDLVAAISRQQAVVAARAEQGATPPLERNMLQVQLRRLGSERLLQAGIAERSLIELKRSLGMAPDAAMRIRDTLEQLVQQESGVDLSGDGQAADERPDLDAARARVDVAAAQVERARRNGRVDVSLFGAYMRMDAGFSQRAIHIGGGLEPIRGVFHDVAAGVAVTVPLRDRRQGEVAAAQARRAGASAELEATRLNARSELAAARVRDEQARQAVAIYTADTRALARQNLAVVGETYDLGGATVFDVLAEQRRYLDVERAFTDALREAYEARQALRLALGEVQ